MSKICGCYSKSSNIVIDDDDENEVSNKIKCKDFNVPFLLTVIPIPSIFLIIGILKVNECPAQQEIPGFLLVIPICLIIETIQLSYIFRFGNCSRKNLEKDSENNWKLIRKNENLTDFNRKATGKFVMKLHFINFLIAIWAFIWCLTVIYGSKTEQCSSWIFWSLFSYSSIFSVLSIVFVLWKFVFCLVK